MIYTCTLNPSVDYVVSLDNMKLGQLNRTIDEYFEPGGKGINVSLVLDQLGLKSHLLGFLGGFTGGFIEERLKIHENLTLDFTSIESATRVNIKLKDKIETEINASGPLITQEDYEQLLNKVRGVQKDDVFILSGSVPTSISKNVYEEIAKIVYDRGATLIVDATKEDLLSTLKYNPFLIKPNNHELEAMFDVSLTSDELIYEYANKLKEQGAKNILVSLGGDGSMLITAEAIYRAHTPKGTLINTVGAGDSMVAGFISEYIKTRTYYEALKVAAACGSATAYSQDLASSEKIEALKEEIHIEIYKEL